MADLIVGTSAGAIVGTAAAAHRLGLLRDDIDLSGQFPKLLADLIPTSASNPSQVRARELAEAARDGSVATIQSIGRGAMAARNPPVRNLELMIDVLSLGRSWPNPRFHATTTDCYTVEHRFHEHIEATEKSIRPQENIDFVGVFLDGTRKTIALRGSL